jgi:hypothetical protein
MRNLIQYPITHGEAVSAIQTAQEDYIRSLSSNAPGDTTGIALILVEQFLRRNKELFDTFASTELDSILKDSS